MIHPSFTELYQYINALVKFNEDRCVVGRKTKDQVLKILKDGHSESSSLRNTFALDSGSRAFKPVTNIEWEYNLSADDPMAPYCMLEALFYLDKLFNLFTWKKEPKLIIYEHSDDLLDLTIALAAITNASKVIPLRTHDHLESNTRRTLDAFFNYEDGKDLFELPLLLP